MSPVLPFDIIALIIDIVGENKDTDLLKELALVSHSFFQICRKQLFANVELHDTVPRCHWQIASSKKGFLKLLKSRPDVVNCIRKLTYKVSHNSPNNDDHLLSPILRTIPRLNCLTITASDLDWNTLNSSLTSAFLHLIHLPTINHIELSFIQNFPLSSLTPSVNLHRLDIFHMSCTILHEENEIAMPNIHEFRTSHSTLLTKNLLLAKRQDGRPFFKFMDLRRLSMSITFPEDEWNIRYLLPNTKSLEYLQLLVRHDRRLVGLHDILSPSARTLKVLALTVSLHPVSLWLCEELEAMAGHNMLQALSFEIRVDGLETEDVIGSIIQKVERVLAKPGWSALRQVSFKVPIACWGNYTKLAEELQYLPDKYLSHLPKLESVSFDFSAYVYEDWSSI